MKKVEIYDQYSAVYSDPSQNGALVSPVLGRFDTLDPNLTLVHASSGITDLKGSDLTDEQALTLVESLYEESKLLATYTDKIIKLNEGYAELKIEFPDGKKLNRVIYVANQ
jgi:hypothetical protein